jgi:hypothetical protein
MSLTAHETDQVARIAEWKALRPSVLEATLGRLTEKVYGKIGSLVPQDKVGPILLKSFEMAEKVDTTSEIAKLAGLESIDEIKTWDLDRCDALADKVALEGDSIGMAEALVSEAGGIATELLNMPLQAREVILLLKRVGHCYGYPLNESHDDSYLKTLIILSHESDVAKRQALINRLISLEHGNLTEAEVEEENREIVQSIGAGFAEGSTMEFVPVVGMLVSVYNDFEYFHHLAENARRTFQERHLRDLAKIQEIPPAVKGVRESTLKNAYSFGRELFYLTGYGVGFGTGYIGFGFGKLIKKYAPPLADASLEGGQKAKIDAIHVADEIKGRATGMAGLESA